MRLDPGRSRPSSPAYLERRLREEMEAALRSDHAIAAAAHVALANQYLAQLNGVSADQGAAVSPTSAARGASMR